MFNQFKVIWYGLGGAFNGYHPIESRFWLYVAGVLFNAALLAINSFISFNFYKDHVWQESVGLAPTLAFWLGVVATIVLAFTALHFLSHLAYLLSAKVNNRKELLMGVSRWDVFFLLLAVVSLLTIEIYGNYQGSEEIAHNNTATHQEDPTVNIDDSFSAQKDSLEGRYDKRISWYSQKISDINHWTGKSHSCTKTGCPTASKGKGTIGAHWKGTLTAFGSKKLQEYENKIEALESDRRAEIADVKNRKSNVSTSLLSAYNQDVLRYRTEIETKNRTFKGFVFIAYLAAFVVAFLISGITYMGIEYLYASDRLTRPLVTIDPTGKAVIRSKPTVSASGSGRKRYEINCLHCGEKAVKSRSDAKFCSDGCRIAYNYTKV